MHVLYLLFCQERRLKTAQNLEIAGLQVPGYYSPLLSSLHFILTFSHLHGNIKTLLFSRKSRPIRKLGDHLDDSFVLVCSPYGRFCFVSLVPKKKRKTWQGRRSGLCILHSEMCILACSPLGGRAKVRMVSIGYIQIRAKSSSKMIYFLFFSTCLRPIRTDIVSFSLLPPFFLSLWHLH